MKLKYDLSSNIVASFRGSHRLSFLFFYVKNEQKTDVHEKQGSVLSKVKRKYHAMRTCGRVLNLTSKQILARATAKHAMQHEVELSGS